LLPLALVRTRARGSDLVPRWIDPADPELRALAAAIVALFRDAAEARWTRGQLAAEIADLAPLLPDRKLFEGLVKLCQDRVESAADADIDAVALRAEVFALARARGPLGYEPGPLGRPVAADILGEVAATRGVPTERIAAALYGDLEEAHPILGFDVPDEDWLLRRYNVALAQGMLLAAAQVRIRLASPTPARIRQLLRRARFHQLILQARRDGADLVVELDGPISLFEQSTRYGFQLAAFLPSLLLQEGPWRLEADLVWTPRRLRRQFALAHDAGLVSHAADVGGHQTREEQWFLERFQATTTDWALEVGGDPIDLGGRGYAIPDFTLRRGKQVAHLEIVGFWKADGLARRLELLRRYGPGNVILAVSRKLCAGGEGAAEPGVELVPFAQVVPVKAVLEAAEKVSRRVG
jgi:predicted nuclease of restriction endonuclease-like RecB superfamily